MPRCSYSRSKQDGNQWNIRALYEHHESVPVVGQELEFEIYTKGGQKHRKLGKVFWSGSDRDTGKPVILAEQVGSTNQPQGGGGGMACPHCGKPLRIVAAEARQSQPASQPAGQSQAQSQAAAAAVNDDDVPF